MGPHTHGSDVAQLKPYGQREADNPVITKHHLIFGHSEGMIHDYHRAHKEH
jgi:hypothetical protein